MKKTLIIIIILLFLFISILFCANVITNLFQSNSYKENSANNIIQNQESENITISEETYNEKKYQGDFELPINGVTGYASVPLPLYENINSNEIKTLDAGQSFRILDESANFFHIELTNSTSGYVESKYCLVNLPDLIPSIIYDNTNSYKSIFKSSGYSLKNITGETLYNAYMYNNRLDKDEYLMPLLYPMAKKIAQVQKEALENGDCLKIYETFRPYEVQMKISDSLSSLMNSNETVRKGIETSPWNKSWFIAVKLSNHQRGVALDASLAKIQNKEYKYCGPYIIANVTEYVEYTMPTQMHELSSAAATFATPVNSESKTAWKNVKFASSMNENAIKLQNYFTSNGLTPLASEWWHFNDLDTKELTKDKSSNGKFYLKECLSTVPN